MLYISTEKIRYSTVGASFKVTFSVAPDEIGYLQVLNNSFKSMNMCGIPLTAQRAEQTEPSEPNCDNCDKKWKPWEFPKCEGCEYTEPSTDCGWK